MPDPHKTTGRWTYIKLYLLAKLFHKVFILAKNVLKLLGKLPPFPSNLVRPHGEPLIIPSSKSHRRIRLTVYKNPAAVKAEKAGKPSAVHIHFYGGGYLFPHTPDQTLPLIATLLAGTSTPLTVIDATYALSPENPCPAELEDARDIYDHLLAHPEKWDKDRITLSGCSSGGAVCLGLAVTLGKESRDAGREERYSHPIKSIVVLYPMTNWVNFRQRNEVFLSSLPADHGDLMPDYVLDMIQAAHFFSPGGLSEEEEERRKRALERNPSVSPALADERDFPLRVGIWTTQWDVLRVDADELRDRLERCEGVEEDGTVRVSGRMIVGVGHGWDGEAREGQLGWDERNEAYKDLIEAVGWTGKIHRD